MAQANTKSNWTIDKTILTICALAYAIFFVGLNRAPVPTVDGAVRATEARTIVETGDWFPIRYQNVPVNDHPPLFVWITALSFKIFGINDFAANFPARLFAALTLLVTGLIALEVGFSRGLALLAVVILGGTRDFVLSSVRGYIEPLLEFFIYTGLWLVFRQRRRSSYWASIGAGVCIFGAFFSKGPPALWPLIAFTLLLIWLGGLPGARLKVFGTFLLTIAICFLATLWWIYDQNLQADWKMYLEQQVLGSALDGRGGAQQHEPLYFVEILLRYYWPWLPFLVIGIWRSIRWLVSFEFTDEAIYSWIFGIFALGFIVGFSVVRWKFWYYIAPAYPALALFIASTMYSGVKRWVQASAFRDFILVGSVCWILIGSVVPIALHKERVPEVLAFKDTIVHSNIAGPVLFFGAPNDHNKVATSGEWYFKRPVLKFDDADKLAKQLADTGAAWLILDENYLQHCRATWCSNAISIQSTHGTNLVLFTKGRISPK